MRLNALLAIGFPVALLLAWAFELTPDGLKPTTTVDPADSISHATSQKLTRVTTGCLPLG